MKMMKWALLGGAALAVTATAARADDLAQLKAQIEALQTRVSQLEAQPQASMPSGYSLLSIRDGQGSFRDFTPFKFGDRVREDQGFTLSVVPTADAAPVAEVTVAGELRTVLLYTDPEDEGDEDGEDSLDVAVRGRLNVRGRIDTAVGEVGGHIRLQASGGGNFSDYNESASMTKAYGWWQFAPEWQLMAGYNDNTAALQTNYDWLVSSIPIATVGPSNINNEQMRLTFASGPLSFAISVEDSDNVTTTEVVGNVLTCLDGAASDTCTAENIHITDVTASNTQDRSDIPNVQAYLMYSSDAFTAQIAGLLQDDDFGETDWAVGGGATVGIADAFTFLAAVVVGEGTSAYSNNLSPATVDDEFWGGSVGVIATLSEDTRLELGAGIEDYDLSGEALAFNGGVFWDPVSQVTVGAGATYVEFDFDDSEDTEQLQVWFGTFLRFP